MLELLELEELLELDELLELELLLDEELDEALPLLDELELLELLAPSPPQALSMASRLRLSSVCSHLAWNCGVIGQYSLPKVSRKLGSKLND